MLDRPQPEAQGPNLDQKALAHSLSGFHLIGGRLVPARSGKTFAVVNPATGEEVGRAAEGDASDVDEAVRVADKAQKDWAKMPSRKRGAAGRPVRCAAAGARRGAGPVDRDGNR